MTRVNMMHDCQNFEEINGNMREEQGIQMRWDDSTRDD